MSVKSLIDRIRKALEAPPPGPTPPKEPATIQEAASQGDLRKVKAFLDQGVDINGKDHLDWTPLCHAVLSCREDVVLYLLQMGADVTVSGPLDRSLLRTALDRSRKPSLPIIKALIAAGADANEPGLLASQAFEGEHLDVVECLLAAGADPNRPTLEGDTVLHIAAGANPGSVRVAQMVLARGANPNAAYSKKAVGYGPQGATSLHLAAINGRVEMVELLIASGADVNARDAEGFTPLKLCRKGGGLGSAYPIGPGGLSPQCKDIAEILVRHGGVE